MLLRILYILELKKTNIRLNVLLNVLSIKKAMWSILFINVYIPYIYIFVCVCVCAVKLCELLYVLKVRRKCNTL